MASRTPWPFLCCLVGLALSTIALILLMPSLFDSTGNTPQWIIWSLSGLVLAFGIGTRLLKPASPSPRGRKNR